MSAQSTSLNPKITVHTKTKDIEEIVVMDPIEAYKSGYLDATKQMLNAQVQFVRTLRVTGWDDHDILKALMLALQKYTEGTGLENTARDIRKNLSKKGVNSNG